MIVGSNPTSATFILQEQELYAIMCKATLKKVTALLYNGMNKTKYTIELLEPLVRESKSVSEVLRKLHKRTDGNMHAYLSRRIKELGIDTSHFLGYATFCGQQSNCNKRPYQKILIKKRSGHREHPFVLRRALIECGRAYKCEGCRNKGLWRGKPITLQVDHKNGDWLDNTPDNLAFMCPNCHSQTPSWCGQQGKTTLITRKTYKRKIRRSTQT